MPEYVQHAALNAITSMNQSSVTSTIRSPFGKDSVFLAGRAYMLAMKGDGSPGFRTLPILYR